MKLTNMAYTKDEIKKRNSPKEVTEAAIGENEKYPWGLSLHLNEDCTDKLGIDVMKFSVGDTVRIEGIAKITEISKTEQMKNSRESMSVQITSLGIARKEFSKQDAYQKAKNAGPGEG